MANVSGNGRSSSVHLPSSPSSRPSPGALIATALATLLLVGATGYWWWSSAGEGREIRALPPAQRQALYARTMENLKTICDPAPGRSIREFCRGQAALALEFPECDDDCRRTARRHMSLPRE